MNLSIYIPDKDLGLITYINNLKQRKLLNATILDLFDLMRYHEEDIINAKIAGLEAELKLYKEIKKEKSIRQEITDNDPGISEDEFNRSQQQTLKRQADLKNYMDTIKDKSPEHQQQLRKKFIESYKKA